MNQIKHYAKPLLLLLVSIAVLSGFFVLSTDTVEVVASGYEESLMLAQEGTTSGTTGSGAAGSASGNGASGGLGVKGINLDDSPSQDGGFVPCGNSVDDPCNISHLFRAFIAIINYLIGMAGFVAVLFIVYSGVRMVASQGNEGSLKEARGYLSGAVIGLVLVAIAFIAINTILASGSLGLGLKNGAQIFTDPRSYIQGP